MAAAKQEDIEVSILEPKFKFYESLREGLGYFLLMPHVKNFIQ